MINRLLPFCYDRKRWSTEGTLVISLVGLSLLPFQLSAQAFHNPEKLFDPTPYGFSHSAVLPMNGSYVMIAGQSGASNKQLEYSADFRIQVKNALLHLKYVLDAHDLVPENIVKITVLIVDHSPEKLTIWSEEMKKLWNKGRYPTSTLIPVMRLASEGMLFEVDAIAFKPAKDSE